MPKIALHPFGSYVTRIYLPNADVDLVASKVTQVIVQTDASKAQLMKSVARILQRYPHKYTNLNLISSAKVPIIRFVDIEHNLNFDVSFNKLDGLYQVNEVLKSFKIYPELRHLIFVMKIFLRQRDLNNTYIGGVGSFLLFCIILAFLRHYKRELIESKGAEELKSVLLSEYLLKFLEFFGVNFDCARQRIIMGDNGKIVEKGNRDAAFSLISPQYDSHDIGNAAFRIKEVFSCFKNRFNFMTNFNYQQGESILKYLINPSRKDFGIYLH
jgi:non-canonical poly(A) RNA polymerase PAPD5/7